MDKLQYKLNNNWILWFHNKKNNWKLNGYKKLLEFNFLEEFLYFVNNYNLLGELLANHYFIMKNDIKPIWEDENNKLGGCISIKINNFNAENIWNKLCFYIIGNTIPNNNNINGISICIKNLNYTIIHIWLKEKDKIIINFIADLTNESIIYKKFEPEY